MFKFHIIITILVFILIIGDSILLLWLWGYGFAHEYAKNYQLQFSLFLLLQLPLVYFLIYQAYIRPIHILNQDIARFLTGSQDDINVTPSSWSRGMNYLTSFFIKSLQILKVFKQELRDGRKLRSEVEIASEIQKHIFEKEETVIPSLEVAMATTPATEVWWDSLDIITWKDQNYFIYVWDVTGHGVPSGFVMMMVNSLISAFVQYEKNGANILAETNAIVKPRVKQNMLMTCVLLRWDESEKKMYFTWGWHEHLLVYKAKADKVYKMKTGWVAIWMVRDSSKILKEQQIAFDPNDVIILYTDGISEARYRSEQNGILFGVDRMVESVMKCDRKTAEAIFQQITIDLSAFMGYKHKQYDDITLSVIRYLPFTEKWVTHSEISQKIDLSHITEWNWWKITNKE
jgi:serine phosphatase RsbU (regulator of sigma subunit)